MVIGQEGHPGGDHVLQRLGRGRRRRRRGRLDNALDGGQIMGRPPPPQEGLLVEVDGDAVELDGSFQGFGGNRDQALLIGISQHETVRGDAIAQQFSGDFGRRHEMAGVIAGRGANGVAHFVARKTQIGVPGEVAVHGFLGVDDGEGLVARHLGQHIGLGGGDDVTGDQHFRAARRHPHGVQVFPLIGDAHMADHRAALLRQAGGVQHGRVAPLKIGRHAQQSADGHHPGAADTSHHN